MKQIFMVEDNPDHAFLIQTAIGEDDCKITHFPEGLSLFEFFEANPGPEALPELVLLDLNLPQLDGFQILSKMRANARLKLIPVVMLTTSKRPEEIKRAYELGAHGFVSKSEDFGNLKDQLACVKNYWLKTVEKPSVT